VGELWRMSKSAEYLSGPSRLQFTDSRCGSFTWFFCVVLLRHSPPESFHSVVLVHRSGASLCYVVPNCRSVVLSFCYIISLRCFSIGSSTWTAIDIVLRSGILECAGIRQEYDRNMTGI